MCRDHFMNSTCLEHALSFRPALFGSFGMRILSCTILYSQDLPESIVTNESQGVRMNQTYMFEQYV